MRKVIVLGANGKVGRILIDKLKNSSRFHPVAAVRKEEQLEQFKEKGVDTQLVSLEDSVEAISQVLKGNDAIVLPQDPAAAQETTKPWRLIWTVRSKQWKPLRK